MKVLFKILCISFLGISTAISMEEEEYTYPSLAALQQKASKIHSIHGLSVSTYAKMNPEVLEFFREHGGLVDENSVPAPGVKVIGDFAIDTKSLLYEYGNFDGIRLGQNTSTGEFLAFKPMLGMLKGVPACESSEANWLKYFGRYRGVINHFNEPKLCHVAMNLIDGLNFPEARRKGVFGKINHHARYLIAYNLVKALEAFKAKSIQQGDRNEDNFMISTANFDVEIIDFECLEKTGLKGMKEEPLDRAKFFTSLISKIFLADGEGMVSKDISVLKKYQHGTFEKLIEFIGNKIEENCLVIYVDDIIEVLPNLS